MHILQVDYASLYKCLTDENRLRMLHLLSQGPLCGCHFVEALALEQVTISKQLNYMKRLGLLESERQGQWMIYRVVPAAEVFLQETLACLLRHGSSLPPFEADQKKLAAVKQRMASAPTECCEAC